MVGKGQSAEGGVRTEVSQLRRTAQTPTGSKETGADTQSEAVKGYSEPRGNFKHSGLVEHDAPICGFYLDSEVRNDLDSEERVASSHMPYRSLLVNFN